MHNGGHGEGEIRLGRGGRSELRVGQTDQAVQRQVVRRRSTGNRVDAVDRQLRRAVGSRIEVALGEPECRSIQVLLDPEDLCRRTRRRADTEVQRQHRLGAVLLDFGSKLDIHVQEDITARLEHTENVVQSPGHVLRQLGLEDLLAGQDAELLVLTLQEVVVPSGRLDAELFGGIDGMQPEQHFVGLVQHAPPSWGERYDPINRLGMNDYLHSKTTKECTVYLRKSQYPDQQHGLRLAKKLSNNT